MNQVKNQKFSYHLASDMNLNAIKCLDFGLDSVNYTGLLSDKSYILKKKKLNLIKKLLA